MMSKEHPYNEKPVVLFVPGGIMPGELSYSALLRVLGDKIRPIVKDLEVYATDTPPSDYSLDLEVDGIRRIVEATGLKQIHLVGYSGGGAFSLAFAAKYPEMLDSLALFEPAWIGTPAPEDEKDWVELTQLMTFQPAEQMAAFNRWQFRREVLPTPIPMPPGPAPEWMAKRPEGLRAIAGAFNSYRLDQERYRLMDRPVYYALGSLSTRFYERSAKRLAGLFPDFRVEEYAGRSHFDPPQRAEPERVAKVLLSLWEPARETLTMEKMGR